MNRIIVTSLKILLTALLLVPLVGLRAAEPIRLENSKLTLRFDAACGVLTAVENKLTGETYKVSGDEFAIETVEGDIGFDRLKPVAVKLTGDTLTVSYEGAGLTVEVRHRLGAGQHFVERSMWLTSDKKLGVKKIVLGRPTFTSEELEVVSYRQPRLMNPKGQEPILTCFGRTARGGFFTGVELPFDASSQNANTVVLAYRPNLRIRAGERLDCEPAYFGVYRRAAGEAPQKDLPLRSESDAMVAMTAAILPPQNKYLGACLASWWSEMYRGPYRTMADVENHMRAIDFALECGIDISRIRGFGPENSTRSMRSAKAMTCISASWP